MTNTGVSLPVAVKQFIENIQIRVKKKKRYFICLDRNDAWMHSDRSKIISSLENKNKKIKLKCNI